MGQFLAELSRNSDLLPALALPEAMGTGILGLSEAEEAFLPVEDQLFLPDGWFKTEKSFGNSELQF